VTAHAAREAWPAAGAAVPAARHLVRTHLRSHGLAALVDNAELIVSELVGNVVLHVGGTVEVDVEVVSVDEVLLSVTDGSPLSPHLRVFSRTSSTGRGMRLVHSLSAEHGVRPHGDGKTIWVRLTPASSDRGDDEIAEVFADIDWIAELAEIDLDGEPVRDLAVA
jgi:anti-sigma regulatory factor (Ser/Thr protein kinase)